MGNRAPPAVLLTGDASYDTKRAEELLPRASGALLGPPGYAPDRLQSWPDAN